MRTFVSIILPVAIMITTFSLCHINADAADFAAVEGEYTKADNVVVAESETKETVIYHTAAKVKAAISQIDAQIAKLNTEKARQAALLSQIETAASMVELVKEDIAK